VIIDIRYIDNIKVIFITYYKNKFGKKLEGTKVSSKSIEL